MCGVKTPSNLADRQQLYAFSKQRFRKEAHTKWKAPTCSTSVQLNDCFHCKFSFKIPVIQDFYAFLQLFVCIYLGLCEESPSTSLPERGPDFQRQKVHSEPRQALLVFRPSLCLPVPFPSGLFLLLLKLSFQEDAAGISEASLDIPRRAVILYHRCRSCQQHFLPRLFCLRVHRTIWTPCA